jgi:carotenoid cleavage dioxygenase-like enzyme
MMSTAASAAGFLSLQSEGDHGPMSVSGAVPEWLQGSLFRVGPGKFEAGQQAMRHWFDGYAMLHRFDIADGAVSYANRFLQSRSYRAANRRGEINLNGASGEVGGSPTIRPPA